MIIPAILSAMKMADATLLFWPRVDLQPFMGCVAALLEALAMGFLVAVRWQKRIAE